MTSQPWNQLVQGLSENHIFQTWQWGAFKSEFNWTMHPLVWRKEPSGALKMETFDASLHSLDNVCAAVLLLVRSMPIRGFGAKLGVGYVPKGPHLPWTDKTLSHQILSELVQYSQERGAIFLKIDPDIEIGTGIPGTPEEDASSHGERILTWLEDWGWRYSKDQIQFRNTVIIPIDLPEDKLLRRMKQKTRYNVRLSKRRGVTIRLGSPEDFKMIYQMYAETSIRDGFVIRDQAYYLTLWKMFYEDNMLDLLIASFEEFPIAAVVVFRFGSRAYYMHGMSVRAHKEKMPNYLLQWEAIKIAKSKGCTTYDLWGAPDEFAKNDPLWGVYRFKSGFGGIVTRYAGAWDLPLRPVYHRLYTQLLPKLLSVMRKRSRNRTQEMLGNQY